VPRLDEFEMGGVYYAATQAEAQLCAGDPVLIVGGGNSAGQAAMFLSRHASQCRLLIRGGDLGKSMSRYLVDQIERNDLVQVCLHSEVVELGGERELETVTVADTRSGERSAVPAKALFVFIGASPHTEWLEGQLATDDAGFLLTGRDVQDGALAEHNGDPPFFLETSVRISPSAMSAPDRLARCLRGRRGPMAVRLVTPTRCPLAERKADDATCPPRSRSVLLPESVDGCEECLATGDPWLHLRICLECGKVGCCDNSPNRHASAHARTSSHPLIRSLEPGEDWSWCYVDDFAMLIPEVKGETRIPPSPLGG
jgi:thioredoxin reductase (NADPH)